jgi:hypothetical protein
MGRGNQARKRFQIRNRPVTSLVVATRTIIGIIEKAASALSVVKGVIILFIGLI